DRPGCCRRDPAPGVHRAGSGVDGARSRRVHRGTSRRTQAADALSLRRRRTCSSRARVRRPPARREPRAGLPMAARAQPQAVRGRVRRGPHRRHLPRRPVAAVRGHPGRDRPAARRRTQLLRRVVQHDPRARLRLLHPARVGVAPLARRVHPQPGRLPRMAGEAGL
ncbi:MAG: Uncharacterized protein Rv0487/MT0505 clustered with mycothiol biosynthesis gene, partial [uncultured Nocardioidaceae bacterium]